MCKCQATALEKPVTVAVPAEEQKQASLPSLLPTAKQSGSSASPGAARILQALATRYPMKFTKSQLATLAHLSARGGTYQKYLTHLKAQGDITLDNGYIQLTEQGKDRAEPYTNQVTATENPIAMWQRTLSSGARRIFDVLVQTYPNTITRSDIGQQTGLSPRSGTFQKYMRMLRNNGLIELDGQQIKASKTLFL